MARTADGLEMPGRLDQGRQEAITLFGEPNGRPPSVGASIGQIWTAAPVRGLAAVPSTAAAASATLTLLCDAGHQADLPTPWLIGPYKTKQQQLEEEEPTIGQPWASRTSSSSVAWGPGRSAESTRQVASAAAAAAATTACHVPHTTFHQSPRQAIGRPQARLPSLPPACAADLP